jgi:branched-chain amino acid transport system substrate-binding protein
MVMAIRGKLIALFATAVLLGAGPAAAEPLRIGVLTDLSSFGSDVTGKGSLVAARMAVEDFHGEIAGRKIEIISADTQNRPDIAVGIASEWIDREHVDAIVDLPQSAVSLAVQQLAKGRHKVDIVTSGITADLTGKACSPYAVHWAEDTNAMAKVTVSELAKTGLKKWYFVAADFAFGRTMEKAAQTVVESSGGAVVGVTWPPANTTDWSSFILDAQNSPADVVAFITIGNDFVTSIKQAHEFGLPQSGKKIAGLVTYLSDVHSLGLDMAQGLFVTSSFYWNQNDSARAFARRFEAEMGRKPNKTHASLYAAMLHYLRAVHSVGSDPEAVIKWMKSNPADYLGKPVHIRADGQALFDLDVYQVKSPGQEASEWDLYNKIGSVAAAEAFAPRNTEECTFLK